MAIDLPVVVIEASTPRVARGLDTLGTASRALGAWQQVSGRRAIDLPASAPIAPITADAAHRERVDRVEAALRTARATLDVGDRAQLDEARASLAMAYGEARAHPEDPEAPSLVAELLRTFARGEALAGDPAAAAALRARAAVFDGGRVLGLSEALESSVVEPAPRTIVVTLELAGLPIDAVVRIDGVAHAADETRLALVGGEHHLRVTLPTGDGLDATLLYAAWFDVGEPTALSAGGEAPFLVAAVIAPPPRPCTRADLAPAIDALAAGDGRGFAVTCALWARVRRIDDASIELRVCSARSCGAASVWLAPESVSLAPPPAPIATTGPWRSGWTYLAIGAATVAAGSIVAWRLGAFDRAEAPPPTWRWEGVTR